MDSSSTATRVLLRVRGTVQGVGFRPFVHRTARELGLHGWVRNDPEGVLVRAEGAAAAVDALLHALFHGAPCSARVEAVQHLDPGPEIPGAPDDFLIAESTPAEGAVTAHIPADLALCADCLRELVDPKDRRFRYPFINCTQCGPRYSIIEALPYDRQRTTMRCFRMCRDCRQEYEDPASRRFHAEPIACPVCGPQLSLVAPDGQRFAFGDAALADAAWHLAGGRIVAVKGLGGYHLMCDARNESAVAELRRRKRRDEKPFAVMFRDLAQLRVHAEVGEVAARLLTSPEAPVVLVPRLEHSRLAAGLAPGNPWLGALLPYTPLHLLLLGDFGRPVVATSANLTDEPLCTDNDEARRRLAEIADVFLEHDRPIARAVDDSVVRLAHGDAPIVLRRARGYAPRALRLPSRLPGAVLCLGGQMKNTIAIAQEDEVTCSAHLGDLESAATRELFTRTIAMLGGLRQAQYSVVVHDQHPDYASTIAARASGLPTLGVQHHLAHVLSCLLEHNQPADDVLGIAFDGTGYGSDGTIWGGEFIRLDGGRAERFARLRPFRLAGGEAAARDARRVALALAMEAKTDEAVGSLLNLTAREESNFRTMLTQGLGSPVCSSVGRLFDGISALLGLGLRNNFEGQLPLAVEAAASEEDHCHLRLSIPVQPAASPGARFDLDWRPAIHELLRADCRPATVALAFHYGLVDAMVETARRAGTGTVVLTGGCFQNARLHSLACEALTAARFRVLVHRTLSPNDNSIAAGQAVAALWQLTHVTLPT